MKRAILAFLILTACGQLKAQKVLVGKSHWYWDLSGSVYHDSTIYINKTHKSYYDKDLHAQVFKSDTEYIYSDAYISRNVNRYDHKGRILTRVGETFKDGEFRNVVRTLYDYDANFEILQHFEYWNETSGRWELNSKTSRSYLGNKPLTTRYEYYFSKELSGGEMVFTYDDKLRPITLTYRVFRNGELVDRNRELYFYNSEGQRYLKVREDFQAGTFMPLDSSINLFDANNQLTGTLTYHYDSSSKSYLLDEKYDYAYTNGHISKSERFKNVNGLWVLYNYFLMENGRVVESYFPATQNVKHNYEYTSNGDLLSATTLTTDPNNNLISLTKKQYSYDSDGDLIEERDLVWLNSNWVQSYKDGLWIKYYYASEATVHTSTDKKVLLYPNPARNSVSVSWTDNITPQYVTLTDVTGRLISRAEPSFAGIDLEIDIESLSPGLYFVTVYDSAGTGHTERLMKH